MISRHLAASGRTFAAVSALALLAGCATLPSSGPTAGDIKRGAKPDENGLNFSIVNLDASTVASIETREAAVNSSKATLASLAGVGRPDVVGPGDILGVSIYEVGASLFGAAARDMGATYDPSARGEAFPAVVVDRDGAITLPYIGRLVVAGHTPVEIQKMIETSMRGKSQSPQALVGVRLNVSATVYVSGDVRKPGRFDLTLQRERLLDAIALAGGESASAEDTVIRFNRGARTVEERMGRITPGTPDDIVLLPGDRIELIRRPRSFIVLGASNKVAQVSFDTGDLSLAEAVARVGGPSDAVADPTAVFLFRYDMSEPTSPGGKPVVYRLDMMKPASYFLSQKLAVRDKDVIYMANAAANRPAKLVNILNALFSPIINARLIAGN